MNPVRRLASVSLLLSSITLVSGRVHAATGYADTTTLHEVRVVAVRGMSWSGPMPWFPQSNQHAKYIALERIAMRNQQGRDVRCHGGQQRDVTSHAAPEVRLLAAEAIMSSLVATRNQGKDKYPGGVLTVIFADGGSERYKVRIPEVPILAGSIKIDEPVKDSLKMGRGKIRSRSCK